MPRAERKDSEIIIEASFREKAQMQQVPGAFHRGESWHMPLSWASCQALRGSFPETLEIGDELASWALDYIPTIDRLEELRAKDGNEYPFAYQDIAVEFMRFNNVLLADEMGLGKSKEVIDTILSQAANPIAHHGFYLNASILIVCPNSLKYVWRDEWAKWAPAWNVHVVDGNLPAKKKILERGAGVFIINYESLRSLSSLSGYGSIKLSEKEKEDGILNRKWDLVVADEAHRIKDHKAKQTRALWRIGETAAQRIALTGTPIANSPVDLWSIMHFVEPKDWPSRNKYIERYCMVSYNIFGGLEVVGLNPRTEQEFQKILNPHFLRRTKAEVLKSLPEKTYQVRYVDMAPKQKKAYADMRTSMIAELDSGLIFTTSPLVRVGKLNQLASALPVLATDGRIIAFEAPSCKVDAVLEILDEAPDQPLVVFAVNLALVTLIVESLEAKGIRAVRVTGEESPETRASSVAQFQAGEAQVIVLTSAAGSEGLTLTAASRLVYVQHPWSHIEYTQSQERIHRPGQKNAVQIIDIVTRGTIEERVLDVLFNKAQSMQELCQDPHFVKRLLTDA